MKVHEDEAGAWAALDHALLSLAERDEQPPCAGRWAEFTADDPEALQRAATCCAECPIRAVCEAVVPYVAHGAWAGRVVVNGKAAA